MLFILAMEPLHKLLEATTGHGILQSITEGHVQIRTSLYADDAALFLRPSFQDLVNIQVLSYNSLAARLAYRLNFRS